MYWIRCLCVSYSDQHTSTKAAQLPHGFHQIPDQKKLPVISSGYATFTIVNASGCWKSGKTSSSRTLSSDPQMLIICFLFCEHSLWPWVFLQGPMKGLQILQPALGQQRQHQCQHCCWHPLHAAVSKFLSCFPRSRIIAHCNTALLILQLYTVYTVYT